jgi:putative DNA primase/helicase
MRNGLDHGTKPSSVGISIDQNEAARFLQALDPSVIHFTFQVFDDNYDLRQDRLAKKLHGTLQKCWNKLVDLSERGAGIFVTINETDLKGREAENIVRVRALFVDLDGASLDAILNDQEIPSPHIIIESSDGKFHVYWKVSNVPLKAFRALQKFLIDRFNGDKKGS